MTPYDFAKVLLRATTGPLLAPKVTGVENVPVTGGLVVAANHRSYLDPPLLGTWFPRPIHYMAKQELWKIPLLGPLISSVNAFPVNRDAADIGSIKRALRILRDGGLVGIFPEGTRNVSGEAEVKSGAVVLASSAQCPVVPVGLVRTELAIRRLRGAHIEIRIGAPMVFQGSARKATKAEIDAWTDQLMRKIAELSDQNVVPEL
jgi:1-acyl-sn-glycerol-3-phosphate acyltransferase